MKQQEFEAELKKPTKQLKPRIFGCFWLNDSSHKSKLIIYYYNSNIQKMCV